MVPRNQRQEALSFAYVRAVAAHAGLVCAEPDRDFGVDLCLRKVRQRGQRFTDSSGQLDLQIKSTTRANVTATEVVYDLEVKNYDDLREGGDNCPRVLVVLVLPEDEQEWLTQTTDELTLRHCAYWLSLEGFAATTSTTTVRVRIPKANMFTGAAVEQVLAGRRRSNP